MLRTPPLQLLPTFASTARLLSFKAAAAELNITPSAVSQQIKALENHTGWQLFERQTRAITLTPIGKRYYQCVKQTLDIHQQGYEALLRNTTNPTIRLSAPPLVTLDILIPALPVFHAEHPNIDLRIETNFQPVDFDQDNVDMDIRIGTSSQWHGLVSNELCDLHATIVGANNFSPLLRTSDLEKHTLIHSRSNVNDWERAEVFFQTDLSANKNLYFDSYQAAITACQNGLGLAFGLLPLSYPQLSKGSLKALIPNSVPIPMACYLVHPFRRTNAEALATITEWLQGIFAELKVTSNALNAEFLP